MSHLDPFIATSDIAIPVLQKSLGSWRLRLERAPYDRPTLTNHYDRAASTWQQRIERLGMNRAYSRLLRHAIRTAPPLNMGSPLHVLDCGIGTGALALALARIMPERVLVEGADISSAMLATARERLAESGVLQATTVADIRALPHADEQFDLTMAAHVIEHLAQPQDALREMARVTRPGGRIIVCLTRRSPLGMLVQTRWRTHRFRARDVEPLLESVGLSNVTRLKTGSGLFDAFSTAWVARKPAEGSLT